MPASDSGGHVTTPHGVQIDSQAIRRSTNDECRWGEIWIDKALSFRVDGNDVAEAAASELEYSANRVRELAGRIRHWGEKLNDSQRPAKRKRGTAGIIAPRPIPRPQRSRPFALKFKAGGLTGNARPACLIPAA